MPRKPRVWYPGAVYHIMCRGNHRHEIYRDEEDRQVYITILLEAKENYQFRLLSYCQMTNHVHLQIETSTIEISQIMKRINMMYTLYFNKKYNFVGHLFQGRYRSELIETDPYNLETSRYIHLNPVRAGMVQAPQDYKWSSYQNYLTNKEDNLVCVQKILGYFKDSNPLLYKKYVEQSFLEV